VRSLEGRLKAESNKNAEMRKLQQHTLSCVEREKALVKENARLKDR
jgi:hypothetical protein